jgi:hypothetical protein
MVAIFAVILAVPALRDFFALELLHGEALWGAIFSAAAGVFVLELGWQYQQWRLPAAERTRRVARGGAARAPSM